MEERPMIKVSDWIFDRVAALGVKDVFIFAGGQAMHLLDSLGRNSGLRHVSALHEQAAAMMAEAYSRVTENFGVAVVTTGPGGTNTVTGVYGAWLDSTPCLIMSGQFRVEHTIGEQRVRQTCLQGTDPVSIVRPITKYAVMVTDPLDIRYHFEKAVWLATHGRPGPVWLDLPLDVQGALVDEAALRPFDPSELDEPPESDLGAAAEETIRRLVAAERPVILAGHGIRLARAVPHFHALVERLGIPVVTSINGLDLIGDDHPLFMGRPNYWGQRGANFTIQNADVLLVIGSGVHLEITGFNHRAFAREAYRIMVDVDPGELCKRTFTPDLPVRADAGRFIDELAARAGGFSNPRLAGWAATCRRWRTEFPMVPAEFRAGRGVHPFVFTDALSDALGPDDILIPGNAGSHFTTSVQVFRVTYGQRVVSEIGIGAMGHSLPSAIAAQVAAPGRRVVCLTGDGGVQLNIQELQTVVNYRLPLKIFVMANNGYASIGNTQKNFFEGRLVGCTPESGLGLPDMTRIARAYGIPSDRITGHRRIREKIAAVIGRPGPVLCVVSARPDAKLLPRLGSRLLPDGSMVSNPLEDLTPPLSREKLRKHLFIKPWEE
jgi:acetolactate synthase-1/2/3 large subunit